MTEGGMELDEIERIIRAHSRGHNQTSLDSWLTRPTLCRFRDWVPRPADGETRLMDIGCYQPAIGYYAALGWREIIGVAKEEGECSFGTTYTTADGAVARNHILDVETETIPRPDETVDAVLMMEVFEHFGLDPMHAMAEANRVLRPGGLLVFSTPNAASFINLWRIAHGSGPYTGLEFSGFSTNRHNRIYDCEELCGVMAAAGFEVERCTSRGYGEDKPGVRMAAFESFWKVSDALTRFRTRRRIERGDYIFIRARKRGPVAERYPRVLYFDPQEWPEWFDAIREKSARPHEKSAAAAARGYDKR